MMAGRSRIPRRKRFFVGCEGESEQGYSALLQMFADSEGLAVHIEAKVLTRAGDPLALTQRAISAISQGERASRSPFAHRFLIFDTDLLGKDRDRDTRMGRIAEGARLILIRQNRCFESFLLRHFDGHENDRPATNSDALSRLRQIWPEYRKGVSASELKKHIGLADIRKAAANPLNSDFGILLAALGFGA